VLIVGADLVMPKLFYFADELRRTGFGYAIYTQDDTPQSRATAARAGAAFIPGPPHRKSISRMLKDLWTFWRCIPRRGYHHADLYCDYHILAAFAYLLILWTKRIPIVFWCRGELYDWPTFSWWQRLYFRVGMPIASVVILKERYMAATLMRAGIYDERKTIELHNTIPLPEWRRERPFAHEEIRLLYLNSFKPWRHAPFCVDLAAALRDAKLPFTMKIVGDKGGSPDLIEEGRRVKEGIARHGLGDRVSVLPFADDPASYFEDADVFVLPAELIYCNYGLLEAMAHGLVPMVNSEDPDHALIVEAGVSGFAFPLDPQPWVVAIRHLIEQRDDARAMSCAARAQIERRFSTETAFARYATAVGLFQSRRGAAAQSRMSAAGQR
jgi:glycosyltransferase involved in cell wall biosynthesis